MNTRVFNLQRPIASSVSTRGLPLAVIILAVLTVLVSLTMSFGLLSFTVIHNWTKNVGQAAPARRPELPGIVQPDPRAAAERETASVQQRLAKTRGEARELDQSAEDTRIRISSLREQEPQLARRVEEHRRELSEAEAKARRSQEEQRRVAERLKSLRTQAADLERRIAALQASIEEAKRATRTAHPGTQNLAPQFVECVRGGIILQPQAIHIASAALDNGLLGSSARQHGVYFLVRPTGFESFITARRIARASGVVVGYEPSRSGAEEK
ncbi:MAG: hypothetical protein WB992_12545 [Bryobacteraceae bacterium]